MNHSARKKALVAMLDAEKQYREYYRKNPDVYFYSRKAEVYHNWEEFTKVYKKYCKDEKLCEKEPTYMENELDEGTFFINKELDVGLLLNARYCPPFWHHLSFIKIMYVLQGEIDINLRKDWTVTLKCGNFIVVPPNIEQSVFSYHDSDIVVNIFIKLSTFESAFSSLLMESKDLSSFFWKVLYGKNNDSILLFKCNTDSYLDNLVYEMLDVADSEKNGKNFMLISLVMMFLSSAFYRNRQSIMKVNDTMTTKDRIPAMLQYIYENYNDITLSAMAKNFNVSEGYLSRLIKDETGYSLSHILIEQRLIRAAQLLKDTNYSIENVMYTIGYSDISYFYRVFKRKFGMTPSQYRNCEKIENI